LKFSSSNGTRFAVIGLKFSTRYRSFVVIFSQALVSAVCC
jgi:hypothetical protein